jgi:hypothetical protein
METNVKSRQAFRRNDLTRAIKSADAAGLKIARAASDDWDGAE